MTILPFDQHINAIPRPASSEEVNSTIRLMCNFPKFRLCVHIYINVHMIYIIYHTYNFLLRCITVCMIHCLSFLLN